MTCCTWRSFILLIGISVCTPSVFAANYYAELAAVYHKIDTGGSEFNPLVTRVKLGMPLSDTVSIEGLFGTSMQDDKVNGLSLDIEELAGVYLRYQNNNNYNGVSLYFLGGQANTTIKTAGINAVPTEKYTDFSWGLGLEERSQSMRNMIYTLEYIRYYDGSELQVTGISLGVKYHF